MAYVTRDDMVDVFRDTEEYYSSDENLKRAIQETIKNTSFYEAEDYPALPAKRFKKTAVSVFKRRSFDAAISMQRKHLELRIAVHNFASATNPGGGVKGFVPLFDALSCAQHRRELETLLHRQPRARRFDLYGRLHLHAGNYRLQERH